MAAAACLLLPLATSAQSDNASGFGKLDPSPPLDGLTPEQVIQRFGERETAFAKAREQYTFRQSVKVETIDDDTNKPNGTYQQVTDIVLSDSGGRTEHVVFAPQNTLDQGGLMMSQADFDDIERRLPFVLTTAELPQYNLTYLGRQRVDALDTYVFDCQPRVLEKNHRYFQGKVWVDRQEFEIVLINGKNVPDDTRPNHADLSPPFTTYYQEIDGSNWFPVYTKGEGVLHFPGQNGAPALDAHMRYVVRYQDYKRFRAKSRILFNGEELPPAAPTTAPPAPAAPGSDKPAVSPARGRPRRTHDYAGQAALSWPGELLAGGQAVGNTPPAYNDGGSRCLRECPA